MILADTNVVSEYMRADVDDSFLRWAAAIGTEDLLMSSITVQEIETGLQRLPPGRRRQALESAWSHTLRRFGDSAIAVFDRAAAQAAADVLTAAAARGVTMSLADAQIAGTCLSLDVTLATRNMRDFAHDPRLRVMNPFDRR